MQGLPHALRALAALGAAGPPPNGGNGVIRGTTRRQPASNAAKPPPQPASCATSPTRPVRRADWREKTRPARTLQPRFREKTRPASVKTPILGCFERAGRTLSRSRPPSDHAGRTFSRTRRDNVATLKPTTPLRVPEQQPLKPPSPLRPKTAPKTPISHPQRRWRSQATGRPGRQGLTTAPAGGGWASPRRPWAISVTNVVKPTRFTSPREDPCDKRRQSKPKNRHFQRKSPRIDDVCNNGAEIHTKNTLN